MSFTLARFLLNRASAIISCLVRVSIFVFLLIGLFIFHTLFFCFLPSSVVIPYFDALHGQMSVKVAFKTYSEDNHPLFAAFHSFYWFSLFFGTHLGFWRDGVSNTHSRIKTTLFMLTHTSEQKGLRIRLIVNFDGITFKHHWWLVLEAKFSQKNISFEEDCPFIGSAREPISWTNDKRTCCRTLGSVRWGDGIINSGISWAAT